MVLMRGIPEIEDIISLVHFPLVWWRYFGSYFYFDFHKYITIKGKMTKPHPHHVKSKVDGTSRTICYSRKIFWRAKNQLSSEERTALQSLKGNTYVNVKKELSSQWFFYTTSRLKTASLTTNPTDIFIPWPYLQRPRWDLLMTDLCS